jgi:hypothetical protein
MDEAFVAQFPGWEAPANVKAVIESEHRRLVSGPSGELPAGANESALAMLHAVLKELPADAAVNIQRIVANADAVDIEGQVKSYEDADVVAAAARKAGLHVPPPQVRREGSGLWTMTLHARKGKPVAVGFLATDGAQMHTDRKKN